MAEQLRDEVTFFDDQSTSYRKEYDRETTDGYSFRVRREKVAGLVPPGKPGMKALDIACGPGIMIGELLTRGYEVTAGDASPEMVARAKEEHGKNPKVTLGVADVYALPYPDKSFDVVTAMGLVEYLADEPKAYKEMTRVLKPGGTLIISYPYLFAPWRIIGRILMLLTWILRKARNVILNTRGHYITHREYSVGEARKMMRAHGVAPDRVWFYNFKLVPWPLDQWFPRFTVKQSTLFERFDSTPLRFIGTGFNLRGKKGLSN